MKTLALALLLQAAPVAAPVEEPVPPAVQRLADYNVLIGSCERYIPPKIKRELDQTTRDATPLMKQAIADWRAAGRKAAREVPYYTRDVCLRMFEAVGTY